MAEVTPDNVYSFLSVLQPYMPVFYVSFLVTLLLTPLMRFLAHRHGIVDDPDGKRKVHTQPIAYLGGVATFLGWLAGVSVSVMLRPHNADATFMQTVQIPPGVLLGAAVIVLFGLMDDIYSLAPRVKLGGQFIAALFLLLPGAIPGGWSIGTDQFLTGHKGTAWMIYGPLERLGILPAVESFSPNTAFCIKLGLLAVSVGVAVFIIISTCNATNLLDGLDGLCSGVTGIMSMGYLILSLYLATQALRVGGNTGDVDPVRITLSLALLGAVLGFLPFNFNPASIFMGDTGSMFLGYMCGTMMLLFGRGDTNSIPWFLASVVIFGLPLLDTLLAIVRRKLNGRPIFSPDSNHFHHFLIKRGLSVRQAVLLCYGVTAVFVSFALVIALTPTRTALGLYMVLFGWLIVGAFKIGLIFQQRAPTNTTINTTVITIDRPTPAETSGPSALTTTVAEHR